MKLALAQMDVKMGDISANRERAAELIARAAGEGADVAVLPETWNLGFFPKENLPGLAEAQGGESRELLSGLAAKHRIHIVGGSLITRKGEDVYNTAYVFDRTGRQVAEYDKIHGFSPAGEHIAFRGGEGLCTFSLDGVRAGLVICYDIRFSELIRALALKGIELLFVCAQWPLSRLEHWRVLNRARAIENQMFAACVNACGKGADGAPFGGHSMLVDPFGEVLAEGGGEEGIAYGEADLGRVKEIRESMGVFRDRKPQLYAGF